MFRRVKVIYGDGSTESYLSSETYNVALEQARGAALMRGTYVRAFAWRMK